MKKLIIPAALLLVACASPFLKHKDDAQITIASTNYTPPALQQENTRHPYKETFTALNIPEEMKQHYKINPKASQVIVGESGTMILIPDNAFKDANGNAVDGKVKLEMIEGISTADILKMNLGTMSDQGVLETGGMVYINAFTESGDTLQLADGKQLDVEIPTDNKKPGMKLWTGITREDGSISWRDPQPLKEELRQIPASALEEKEEEQKEEPKKKENVAGMPVGDRSLISWIGWRVGADSLAYAYTFNDSNSIAVSSGNGYKTEIINLADEKFQNTNIATAEFRSRLPFIKQACDSRVMLCYTNNPMRTLWKSDNAAADTLEKSGCALAGLFRSFANLKQGKINPSDPNAVAALNEAREKAIKKYSENVRANQKLLQGYSFGMKKMGWANVDCLGGARPLFFNARVDNAANENVEVKLIVPSRNIFLSSYKRPNGDYSFTHGEYEQTAGFPEGQVGYIIGRSGSGENLRFDVKKFIFGQNSVEQLSLHPGTEAELALALGNEPPQKEKPQKEIDDWYTKALRSGKGCLCNSESGVFFGWGGVNK